MSLHTSASTTSSRQGILSHPVRSLVPQRKRKFRMLIHVNPYLKSLNKLTEIELIERRSRGVKKINTKLERKKVAKIPGKKTTPSSSPN